MDAVSLSLDDVLGALDLDPAAADLEQLSLVLVHAARCAELRARALLPASSPPPPEVTGEEATLPFEAPDELAERLAGYTVFRAAADVLRAYEAEAAARFGRPERTGAGAGAGDGSGPAAAEGAAGGAATAPADGLGDGAAPSVGEGDGSAADGEAVGATGVEALLAALREVWERATPGRRTVFREPLRVEDRMAFLRERLRGTGEAEFASLFAGQVSRLEIVVTFLALLELIRLGEVGAVQAGPFAPIRLRWRGAPASRGGGRRRPGASGA